MYLTTIDSPQTPWPDAKTARWPVDVATRCVGSWMPAQAMFVVAEPGFSDVSASEGYSLGHSSSPRFHAGRSGVFCAVATTPRATRTRATCFDRITIELKWARRRARV